MGRIRVSWTNEEWHSAVVDADEWAEMDEDDRHDWVVEHESDDTLVGGRIDDIEVTEDE